MTCLKRALKIAHAAQQQLAVARKTTDTMAVMLFVEILNHYLHYFDQGLPNITASVLQVSCNGSAISFSEATGSYFLLECTFWVCRFRTGSSWQPTHLHACILHILMGKLYNLCPQKPLGQIEGPFRGLKAPSPND